MLITGDMMDRNADGQSDHDLATDIVNLISQNVFAANSSPLIYCTPGNHDVNFESNFLIIKRYLELFKSYIPNYLIVDWEYEIMKKNYEKFSKFCVDIGAKNAEDPFSGSCIIPFGVFNVFLSWLNSSWLSIKEYNDLYGIDKEKTKKINDDGYLNLGYKINQGVIEQFENNKKCSFKINISHHFPRLLDWFDLYSIDKFENAENGIRKEWDKIASSEVLKDKIFSSSDDINYNTSIYEHIKAYNLVLNGHTHGFLEDSPFHTATGIITHESALLASFVNIYEVDLHRGYYTKHFISLESNQDSGGSSFLPNKRKIFVFDEEKFEKKLKSLYTKEDLYYDLLHNEKISSCSDENNIPLVDLLEKSENEIIEHLNNIFINEALLKDNPNIRLNIVNEILAMKRAKS